MFSLEKHYKSQGIFEVFADSNSLLTVTSSALGYLLRSAGHKICNHCACLWTTSLENRVSHLMIAMFIRINVQHRFPREGVRSGGHARSDRRKPFLFFFTQSPRNL